MRRNALLLAFLLVMGLAICWPPSWTNGVLPTVGSKEGKAVLTRVRLEALAGSCSVGQATRPARALPRFATESRKPTANCR